MVECCFENLACRSRFSKPFLLYTSASSPDLWYEYLNVWAWSVCSSSEVHCSCTSNRTAQKEEDTIGVRDWISGGHFVVSSDVNIQQSLWCMLYSLCSHGWWQSSLTPREMNREHGNRYACTMQSIFNIDLTHCTINYNVITLKMYKMSCR